MSQSYEYDANVLVVLAIAALAILACVVLVSLGRGGELTQFPPDVPPLNLPEPGQLTAVDFMALQLPVNLVGYHTQSVDETLRRAANALSARDTRIAVLEQRVSELLASRLQARQEVYAGPGDGPRTEHEPQAPDRPVVLTEEGETVEGVKIVPPPIAAQPFATAQPSTALQPPIAVQPSTAVQPAVTVQPPVIESPLIAQPPVEELSNGKVEAEEERVPTPASFGKPEDKQ